MRYDKRRITVVTRGQATPDRSWDMSSTAPNRLLFLEAMPVLQHVLDTGAPDVTLDIERVLLDRAASAAEYLDLLAALPQEFGGDVVYIRDDESGFLSANGRGGNRVLYSLTAEDVRFYLETNALVNGAAAGNEMPFRQSMTG